MLQFKLWRESGLGRSFDYSVQRIQVEYVFLSYEINVKHKFMKIKSNNY